MQQLNTRPISVSSKKTVMNIEVFKLRGNVKNDISITLIFVFKVKDKGRLFVISLYVCYNTN